MEMRERDVQVKQIETTTARQFVIVLDPGEEAIACLQDFARKYRLPGAEFTGLGAFRDVTLGFFDFETKSYERIRIDEQVEVVTLVGNLAMKGEEPTVHPHVVVAKRDGSAWGGHLLEAHIRPTLEIVATEVPAYLCRRTDSETGLALLSV